MTFRRGGIYLANFNPTKGGEPGKVRPCLVIQNDGLNSAQHGTTAVLPLTTRLMDDAHPMRLTINARDDLRRDSQIMIDQIRAFDNRRFTSGELAFLNNAEMAQVDECLKIVLGMEA